MSYNQPYSYPGSDLQVALEAAVANFKYPLLKGLALSHCGLLLVMSSVYNAHYVPLAALGLFAFVWWRMKAWSNRSKANDLIYYEQFLRPLAIWVLSNLLGTIVHSLFCGVDFSRFTTAVLQPRNICPAVGRQYWTPERMAGGAVAVIEVAWWCLAVGVRRNAHDVTFRAPIVRHWNALCARQQRGDFARLPNASVMGALEKLVEFFCFPLWITAVVGNIGVLWTLALGAQYVLANKSLARAVLQAFSGLVFLLNLLGCVFPAWYPSYALAIYKAVLLPIHLWAATITAKVIAHIIYCNDADFASTGPPSIHDAANAMAQCVSRQYVDVAVAGAILVISLGALWYHQRKHEAPVWRHIDDYCKQLSIQSGAGIIAAGYEEFKP